LTQYILDPVGSVVKKPITFAVILPDTEKPFHAAICTGLANCAYCHWRNYQPMARATVNSIRPGEVGRFARPILWIFLCGLSYLTPRR
jgi:hypothetical protein